MVSPQDMVHLLNELQSEVQIPCDKVKSVKRTVRRMRKVKTCETHGCEGNHENQDDGDIWEWPIYRPPFPVEGQQPDFRQIRTVSEAVTWNDIKALRRVMSSLNIRNISTRKQTFNEGFLQAVNLQRTSLVKEFLKLGVDPCGFSEQDRYKILTKMAESGNTEVMRSLIDRGLTYKYAGRSGVQPIKANKNISLDLDVRTNVLQAIQISGHKVKTAAKGDKSARSKVSVAKSQDSGQWGGASQHQYVVTRAITPLKAPITRARCQKTHSNSTSLQISGQSILHFPVIQTKTSARPEDARCSTIDKVALHNITKEEDISDQSHDKTAQCPEANAENTSPRSAEDNEQASTDGANRFSPDVALQKVAASGSKAMLIMLLDEAGVDLDVTKESHIHAFFMAVQNGRTGCVKTFLERSMDANGCNPIARYSLRPIHLAAFWGHTEVVRVLLQYGADVTVLDDTNHTAWIYTVQNKHDDVADILKANEKQVEMVFPEQRNYLHLVCMHGYQRCVQPLVDEGWDLNAKDANGSTPLIDLVKRQSLFMVRYLCENFGDSLDVSAVDNTGHSAMHLALDMDFSAMGKIVPNALAKAGVDLDKKYPEIGQTALMKHVNDIRKTFWLLVNGADPQIVDAEGYNAVWHATQHSIREHHYMDALLPFVTHNVNLSFIDPKDGLTLLQNAMAARCIYTAENLASSGCPLTGMISWLDANQEIVSAIESEPNKSSMFPRWIRHRSLKVRSLLEISRFAVVSAMKLGDSEKLVQCLEIPNSLQKYLRWDSYFTEQRANLGMFVEGCIEKTEQG